MSGFSVEEEEASIVLLQELIRFPTVSASAGDDGSYNNCASFILNKLQAIGLEGFILPESLPTKPIVIGHWQGSQPELPCVLLNSHYDVVPVVEELWTVPTFSAHRENGKVYGRGTQDMKCVVAQYIAAIEKLIRIGFKPTRSVFLSFIPDEEIGGADGMGILVESSWFKGLQVELALDEGLASTDNTFSIFYGERLPWWVHIKATGNTGHGSRFIDGTAVEQVVGVVNKALQFRSDQLDILHGRGHHAGCNHAVARKKAPTIGDVTSLNVTMLRAGVQAGGKDIINVVPPMAEAGFDVRISPHTPTAEIENQITEWCQEVTRSTTGLGKGQGVTWEFFHTPLKEHSTTSCDTVENPWYGVISAVLQKEFDAEIVPQVFPAATDSRFLRHLGVKAFGFSPMRNIPIMLHEHDEFIDESVYLEGCRVFVSFWQRFTLFTYPTGV